MYWLFAKLAEGRPRSPSSPTAAALPWRKSTSNVRAGRRMILIEGSGRAADALVSLVEDAAI